ncbi:tyrosine-type recombinase/integrase [Fibrobacterota bacterium]
MIKKFYISQPYKKKGISTFYGICKADGAKLFEKSLGTTQRKVAEKWKEKQMAKQYLPEQPSDKLKAKPFSEALREYANHLDVVFKGQPRTLLAYKQYCTRFTDYLKAGKGPKLVYEFTLKDAQDYIDFIALDLAPKTVSEHRKLLKKAFNQWMAYCYTQTNPFDTSTLRLPKLQKKKEKAFWLPEEIKTILEMAPAEYHSFWATLAHTGMRFQEAASLTFDDIDFGKGEITVTGKGDKTRIIPLNSLLFPILSSIRQRVKKGMCFPSIPGTEQGCLKAMKKALDSVSFVKGGENNHHRFRHSFASNLLRQGASIKQVQKLLGHQDVKTTLDYYSHMLPDDLHRAVEMLASIPEEAPADKYVRFQSKHRKAVNSSVVIAQ